MRPPVLGPDPQTPFPPARFALDEPDGLLCIGGDLSPPRLLNAYAGGIFPWFSEGQPILWWSPSERMVFASDGLHLSRRFEREARRLDWTLHFDGAFDDVVSACAAAPRPGQSGTWITPAMRRAYGQLHRLGHAHSVEVREAGGRLVGGLYGVSLGRAFHAESMVSLASGGSKLAMAGLCWRLGVLGWPWFDAQIENPHLVRMGGQVWPRARFLDVFGGLVGDRAPCPDWACAPMPVAALLAAKTPEALPGPGP